MTTRKYAVLDSIGALQKQIAVIEATNRAGAIKAYIGTTTPLTERLILQQMFDEGELVVAPVPREQCCHAIEQRDRSHRTCLNRVAKGSIYCTLHQ